MLQFITDGSGRHAVREQVEMAVKGGCRWIQLSAASVADEENRMREVAKELIPLCTEADAFMVLEDDVDLVDELKVHGVFLRDGSRSTVAEARERLGAHAVVGAYCKGFEEIAALKGLDIDYVLVTAPASGDAAPFYAGLKKLMNDAGIEFHLVAEGDFSLDILADLLKAGCAGVAVSKLIADADNPEVATREILDQLEQGRADATRN